MDLSNEVLNIDLGLEATKIQEVKVGGQKKISADSAWFELMQPRLAKLVDIFVNLQL